MWSKEKNQINVDFRLKGVIRAIVLSHNIDFTIFAILDHCALLKKIMVGEGTLRYLHTCIQYV